MENAIKRTSVKFLLCRPNFLFSLVCCCYFCVLVAKVAADASSSSSINNPRQQQQQHCGLPFIRGRLPVRLAPVHYDLQIEINEQPNDFFFSGSVSITLKQTNSHQNQPKSELDLAPNQIALHADKTLQINSASYKEISANSTRQHEELIESICRDPKSQLLVLTLKRHIKGLNGKLHMKFTGEISDDMRGLYKSVYTTRDNVVNQQDNSTQLIHVEHQLLSTQFESVEARRVFPCFDEPAYKATFEVTLIHPIGPEYKTVLGNWDTKSRSRIDQDEYGISSRKEIVKFARTPPMSTYLVAFVLGEFEEPIMCEPTSGSRVKVRLFAPLNRANEGLFALDVACKVIPMIEDYLGIELSVRKLDLVSIPFFEAGAMENWGLVTFRESQLLLDESNALPSTRRSIAATVIHEIAHHWFGNLLTMNWWNDLWLNEGFATWAEFQFLELIAPELQYRDSYLLDSHVYAMREDSYRTAMPVHGKPDSELEPDSIERLFSPISYNKAAALVRILHDQILGPERFKRAIRSYLREHKYSTATTDDLWNALEGVSKLPVRRLMNSWTEQAGHPIVEVELKSNRELVLRQKRFLVSTTSEPEVTLEELKSQLWNILISMRLFGEKSQTNDHREMNVIQNLLLETRHASVELPLWFNVTAGSGHWIKLNTNFVGFYRVSYSDQLQRMLEHPIREGLFSTADKINLINDAVFLWTSDQIDASQYLRLLSSFGGDSSEFIIGSLVDAFRELMLFLQQTEQLDLYTRFTHFIRQILCQNLAYLFEQSTNGIDWNIRMNGEYKNEGTALALHMLIELNYEPAIKFTLDEFTDSRRSFGKPLEPWIRSPVYFAIARHGSEAQFSELLEGLSATDKSRTTNDQTMLFEELAGALDKERLSAVYSRLQAQTMNMNTDVDNEKKKLDVEANTILELMILSSESGRSFVQQLFEQQADILVNLCKNTNALNALASELAKSMGRTNLNKMADLLAPLLEDDWLTTERQLERHFAQQEARLARNVKSIRDFLTSKTTTDTNGT